MTQQTYGEWMRSNPQIPNLTAVEWLVEQLVELDKQLDGRRKSDDSTVVKLNTTKIYEQAKQMEKEQMKNMWRGGQWSVELGGEFEQYYNEKYKK